jgi:hypothetical protein
MTFAVTNIGLLEVSQNDVQYFFHNVLNLFYRLLFIDEVQEAVIKYEK